MPKCSGPGTAPRVKWARLDPATAGDWQGKAGKVYEMSARRGSFEGPPGPPQRSGEARPSGACCERVALAAGRKSRCLAIGLLATGLLWVGCTTVQVREVREIRAGIEPHEGVTIVPLILAWVPPRPLDKAKAWEPFEERAGADEIADCIGKVIRRAYPTLRIVPRDEFRRAAFPDLDPEAAPKSPDYLTLLLDHPVFRERIAPLGVRYLIFVGGRTEQQHNWGGIECGAGYGGAACLGVVVWDRTSRLAASILDLKQTRSAGEMHAAASGHPWLAILGILPLGLPAFTESRACEDLGGNIARFLAGGNSPER